MPPAADPLVLEIGATTFLTGAGMIALAILAVGLMVRSSVNSSINRLAGRLEKHEDQHNELNTAVAVMAARLSQFDARHPKDNP